MRKRLVRGSQGGRCDVRDHEPGFEPGMAGEEQVEVRIHAAIEQIDTTLGHAGAICHRDREEVAYVAEGSGMEVTARENIVVEHQRIVSGCVALALNYRARVVEGIPCRTKYLGHAAHGVGVLDAIAIRVTAFDLAVRQPPAEPPPDLHLSALTACVVNAGIKRCVATGKSFNR